MNTKGQAGKGGRYDAQARCALLAAVVLLSCGGGAMGQGSRFAVRFYGAGTGQIDRIKVPLNTAPLLNVGNDFTIDFWMRANYADNAGVVASGQNGDGWITGNILVDRDIYGPGDYGDFGVAMGRSGNRNVLAFGVHNGTAGETILGTNHVGDGLWHHVAVTRYEASGLMRIVVDGRMDAENTGPTGNVSYRIGRSTGWPNSDPFLVLGAEKHDAGSEYPSYNGSMDEVRIWSRVLSTNELLAAASRILPPDEAEGLVAWFRLEEGTNQVVRDSASGYPGTLFSAQPGNGEWTSWQAGSNAAPLQPYAPAPTAQFGPTPSLAINWFAPQNIEYALEESASLLPTASWTPLAGATNLRAADSNLTIVIGTNAEGPRFFRASGTPFR